MRAALIIWAVASMLMVVAMIVIAVTHEHEFATPDKRSEPAKVQCVYLSGRKGCPLV